MRQPLSWSLGVLKAMSLNLESFYVINEWSLVGSNLLVRLVPDFFSIELVKPVVAVVITNPLRMGEVESGLANYKAEIIVDIKASASTLELWGEYDETPLSIEGSEVRLERQAYSAQDLVRAIEQIQSQLSESQAENIRLRSHMSQVELFVVDLLNRAQTKKALSSRNTSASDAQADALSRLLRRIRSA